MHDRDPAQPLPASRPFVPRLVGGDGEAMPAPGPVTTRGGAAQNVELHDPTVREVADSLADLFLGAKPGDGGKGRKAASQASEASPTTMHGGATSDPRPTRFFGQSGVRAGHASNGSGTARRAPVPVELLVLGHLPALASAWITQYAAQAAASLGKPVALARLEPGGLSIDLFGVPKDAPVSRQGSPAEAMCAATPLAAAWLIRVDELAEASIADSPRLGAVTVLSGVSESSIVAAYRALKAIAQRAGGRGGAEGPEREFSADLRIALLGASSERAAEASARVRKAAATFLGRPVGVMVCPEKIGMTGMQPVYRGNFGGDAAALLEMIDGNPVVSVPVTGEPGARAASVAQTPIQPPPIVEQAADDRADADWLLDPEAVPPSEPARPPHAIERPSPKDAHEVEPVRPGEATTPPSPRVPAEPPASAPGSLPHPLASLLHLSALPIRCPDAPQVELAADSAGRLHAIAPDEAGVASLLAADSWARANRDLLARALPFLTSGDAVLHVVTRLPAAARGLLGTRFQVHLIARAAAPGEVCVDLN